MKKLFNLFLLLLVVNSAIAQVPQGVSYQAVARSSAGAILASQPVGLRFSIHDATATGTIVYQETFHLTTTPLGLFSVNVGTGAVVGGSFSNINWGSGPKYLQVEMDAAGGSAYVGMGMAQQMMSVPYSLYSGNGVPSGAAAGDMLYWNGSAWVRVPSGIPGQILTVNSDGIPAWSNALLPAISTAAIGSITGSSATGGGVVSSPSGLSVTAFGVCWGTTPGGESVSGAHTTDGSGADIFSSSITGLATGTTYYVRAYATNSLGTVYGGEVSFTTNDVPSVSTSTTGVVTTSSGVCGGNVTATGGSAVTAYGVCWGTSPGGESVSGAHTTDGSGTGSFTTTVAGLTASTTYYVKAYATNGVGTAYGSEVSFTTAAIVVPTLSTASISAVISSGATGGGNITADGGAAVTAYGVCWSTASGSESVAGSHTTDGSGTGSFTSSISGLAPGTTYYVMAYATNSAGTAYGSEVSFTTNAVVPALTTTSAGSITSSGATTGGNVTGSGGASVTAYGVCWSTTSGTESVSGMHTTDGSGIGSFTSSITGLAPGTTYYVMAYATNSAGTAYGVEVSFTTNAIVPALTTTGAGSITSSGATTGGNVTGSGGASVTAYGVCWSTTSGTESVSGAHTTDGTGTGSFTSSISGLSPGTTYYVMAYATNSAGTGYGSEISFTTSTSTLPVVITNSAGSISSTSAVLNGNVTSDGGFPVTARGFMGSYTPGGELTSGLSAPEGSGTGSFSFTIPHFTASTTLYYIAYATNSTGTAYGSEMSFTTLPAVPATVTTDSVDSITSVDAVAFGTVTSDGGDTVINSGFCWSTTSGSESVTGMHTSNHGSTIQTHLPGLSYATTYYIEAYATTAMGTSYGSELSFTTSAVLPTVTTTSAGSITSSGASSGGNVTASGGATVTAHGICWSTTSGAESILGSHTTDGSGIGVFASSISGLSPGTTYYVKAYATNSVGTAYGAQISFTTSAAVATVTTTSGSGITATSATSGGNVTASNGATVTARGVCWSTTSGAESVSGSRTSDGSGTGSFTSSITGLNANTTYYVKAYATNSAGTGYGSEVSFTTPTAPPTISRGSPGVATTSTETMTSNYITADGGTPLTAYGVCWSTTSGGESLTTMFTNDYPGGSYSLYIIYSSTMTGLSPSTTYYVKSYATNAAGTTFSPETFFTTAALVVPTETTTALSSITTSGATSGGNITSDGGAAVTARGVCWSTTSGAESASGTHTTDGTGTGAFTSSITGLSAGTTYYVKAYATNSVGTSYGSELIFTTAPLPSITLGTLGTPAATSETITGNGIIYDGGTSLTAYGVCWSTGPGGESLSGAHTNDYPGGSYGLPVVYGSTITGLSLATTYYVKAYASNAAGSTFSSESSFTTANGAPVLGAFSGGSTGHNTANFSGTITSDGSAPLTAYGFVYSTTPGGELSGTNILLGSGSYTGSMFYSITGGGVVTYFAKAYATNSYGTTYSPEFSATLHP